MILTVNHETVYRYEGSVAHSTQYLRLTPQSTEGQRVLEWKLELPSPAVSSSCDGDCRDGRWRAHQCCRW